MKSLFLFALLILSAIAAVGQSSDPIFFREKSFDFGDVKESGGSVAHEFQFTNLSGRPFKILSVQPSCGCTTSGWTQELIEPGKMGYVTANFDPKGRPGYFSKTLTILTDLDASSIVLQIKGNVVNEVASLKVEDWPISFGNLHMKFNSINLGKQFINKEPTTTSVLIFNSGPESIRIQKVNAPSYLKVNYPVEILPNQTGKLSVLLNSKLKNQYGFLSESIELETTDKEMPRKAISVYATVEESFSHLTAAELAQAPELALEKSTIEIGNTMKDVSEEGMVMIKNTGKKDLIIRSIQSNCTCLIYSIPTLTLKPEQSTTLKLTLKTPSRSGPVQKAVTIYSTDPKNPVQRVIISGLVQ